MLEPICIFTLETFIFAESCNAGGKIFLRGKVKTDFKDMCLNIFEEKTPHLFVMKLLFFPHSIMEMETSHFSYFEKICLIDLKLDFPVYVIPFSFNPWKFLNLVLKCFFSQVELAVELVLVLILGS